MVRSGVTHACTFSECSEALVLSGDALVANMKEDRVRKRGTLAHADMPEGKVEAVAARLGVSGIA